MKTKILVLVAVVIAIVTATIINSSSTGKQKSSERIIAELEDKEKRQGLTLHERVKLAKAKGEKKIAIPASLSNISYSGFSDFDAALAVFTVVIAEPIAVKGELNQDGRIQSGFKFRLIETLSEAPPLNITFTSRLPDELLPINENEFVVYTLGGTTTVDGVEVTTDYEGFSSFVLGNRYLMFLQFDASGQRARMEMGPMSALSITEDGVLQSLNGKPHHLKREIDIQYGNSIERVKADFRARGNSKK